MNDWQLDTYNYELPLELIAQTPVRKRDQSRLMVLSRSKRFGLVHSYFEHLGDHIPEGAILIANNSRVVPARLKTARQTGGKAEFLLLTPLPLIEKRNGTAQVDGLIRPAAKIQPGAVLRCGEIEVRILSKGEYGHCTAALAWDGDLGTELAKYGSLPLPPYIHRESGKEDLERYQTIYASCSGSIAAPTAGLHFSEKIRDSLGAKGIEWHEISLHVGYGTFSPVRVSDIRLHKMHSEYAQIDEKTSKAIAAAKKEGRPVIAIGTTSARCLEGAYLHNQEIAPFEGMIDIFLYPGKTFNVIDGMITNFHLPRSTLLMLVSAFAGRNQILEAYLEAINAGYRFFSYGDAMLITE